MGQFGCTTIAILQFSFTTHKCDGEFLNGISMHTRNSILVYCILNVVTFNACYLHDHVLTSHKFHSYPHTRYTVVNKKQLVSSVVKAMIHGRLKFQSNMVSNYTQYPHMDAIKSKLWHGLSIDNHKCR